MIRLTNSDPVPESLRGAVIALGNFDGVHSGHQHVIGLARDMADKAGGPLIVATFDPHPVRLFKPEAEPFRLTTLDQREELFAREGADGMLVFQFTREFAATTAEDFFEHHIVGKLGATGVVTGVDFTYGSGRVGNAERLSKQCDRVGLDCRAVDPVAEGGEVISSSRIRDALKAGDPQEAARLLTRPFAMRGKVVHGDKRGREIGYPTANLELGNYQRPKFGIYAVTGHLPDGRVLNGAANIGVRPTFEPPKELLEPYFFDFSEDLYGQEIEVAFHHFIRPEQKFDGLDALKEQMASDCKRARELLT